MDVTREEFDTLKARFEELAAKVYQTVPQRSVLSKTETAREAPVWICREAVAGAITAILPGAFTSGQDWEPNWEMAGVTYVEHGIKTVTGELYLHPDTSHGRAAKCVLRWHSPINRTVNYQFGADNFGRVQWKLNSKDVTDTNADTTGTWTIKAGENILIFMTNGSVDRFEMKAGLL